MSASIAVRKSLEVVFLIERVISDSTTSATASAATRRQGWVGKRHALPERLGRRSRHEGSWQQVEELAPLLRGRWSGRERLTRLDVAPDVLEVHDRAPRLGSRCDLRREEASGAVSYTHLTLPTILLV